MSLPASMLALDVEAQEVAGGSPVCRFILVVDRKAEDGELFLTDMGTWVAKSG
jgi:hypothetical protein